MYDSSIHNFKFEGGGPVSHAGARLLPRIWFPAQRIQNEIRVCTSPCRNHTKHIHPCTTPASTISNSMEAARSAMLGPVSRFAFVSQPTASGTDTESAPQPAKRYWMVLKHRIARQVKATRTAMADTCGPVIFRIRYSAQGGLRHLHPHPSLYHRHPVTSTWQSPYSTKDFCVWVQVYPAVSGGEFTFLAQSPAGMPPHEFSTSIMKWPPCPNW